MLYTYSGTYKGFPSIIVARDATQAAQFLENPQVLDVCPLDITMHYATDFAYLFEELMTKVQ